MSVFKKVSFRGARTQVDIIEFSNLLQLQNQWPWSKIVWLFYYFLLWKQLWRFKIKDSVLFWTKIQTLIKTRRNRKWNIPHIVFERCFRWYNNYCKVKVKLWWIAAHDRKKKAFFVPFILFKEIFSTFVFYLNA